MLVLVAKGKLITDFMGALGAEGKGKGKRVFV